MTFREVADPFAECVGVEEANSIDLNALLLRSEVGESSLQRLYRELLSIVVIVFGAGLIANHVCNHLVDLMH